MSSEKPAVLVKQRYWESRYITEKILFETLKYAVIYAGGLTVVSFFLKSQK